MPEEHIHFDQDSYCFYVIKVITDSWTAPSSFFTVNNPSKDGVYELFKAPDSEEVTYSTSHTYASEVLAKCPNAPMATHEEIMSLVDSEFWIDITPDPWEA